MLKDEFISKVAEANGLTKKQTKEVLDCASALVTETVLSGDRVAVGNLIYKPRVRAARAGRNPKTGEALQIPEKKGIAVIMSKRGVAEAEG